MKAFVMILLFVFHLCFVVVNDVFPQQKQIDSLIQLANNYVDDQPEKGARYAYDAVSLAAKINNSALIARSLHILGVCYDYAGNLDSCLYCFNKAAGIFRSLDNIEKLSNVLSDEANAYYVRGNFELALRNQLAALDLRKRAGNKIYVAKSLNNIGVLYRSTVRPRGRDSGRY